MIYNEDYTRLSEKRSIEDLGKVVPEYVQGFNRGWHEYEDMHKHDMKDLHTVFMEGKMLGIGIAKDDLLSKIERSIRKAMQSDYKPAYILEVIDKVKKDIVK